MNKVQELREQAGLSRRELAGKTKMAHSTIARIENGERKISSSQAMAIAAFFNVSTDEILGVEPISETAEPRTPNYRLKELREARGLSLRKLSARTGIDSSTLYFVERHQRNLTAKRAQVLADFFGVSVDYLFGRDTEMLPTKDETHSRRKDKFAIGKAIKRLRVEKGLTQAQLGDAVGKADSTVRTWELGSSEPDNATIDMLAEVFGVSVDCLFGREGDMTAEPRTPAPNRLKELREAKGLTLRELADALEMDYSTFGHIERGRREFSVDSLQRACDYFGVSTDYMLMRTNNAEPKEYPEMPEWKNRLRELRTAAGLTTEELGAAMEIDPSMITHIEKGDKNFSIESLKRACDYFKVTPNVMLGITEAKLQSGITRRESDAVLSKSNKYIRTSKSTGYMEAYYPESPMAKENGWVLLHRLVMSLSIGRPLTNEEVVHHINGDPGDNRLSNLQLFSNNAEHLKWHAEERRNEIIKSLLEQ